MTAWLHVPKWLKVLFALLMVLTLVGAALVIWATREVFKESVVVDLKPNQVGVWLGLELPAKVRAWRAHARGWQDHQVFVRFELPTAELTAFLRRNHLKPQALRLENGLIDLPWWRPGQLNPARGHRLVGLSAPRTKTGFEPTVVTGAPEVGWVTVYIYAFNT